MAAFCRARLIFNKVVRLGVVSESCFYYSVAHFNRTNVSPFSKRFFTVSPFQSATAAVTSKLPEDSKPKNDSPEKSIPTTMNMQLYTLKQAYNRNGNLMNEDVFKALKLAANEDSLNSSQMMQLLSFMGTAWRSEAPKTRVLEVQRLWDLHKSKLPLEASLYNALMKNYLENEHPFDPAVILAEMEKNGITPNRGTYLRLIQKYCEDGNVDAAREILDHMNNAKIPVGESIFNSLIVGYMKNNDEENALAVVDLLKKNDITPSSATYEALMRGYAFQKNMTAIKKVITEAELSGLMLHPICYCNTMVELAIAEDIDAVLEILESLKLSRTTFPINPVINSIMKCLQHGKDDAALKIYFSWFKNTPPRQVTEVNDDARGRFLLRALILYERPAEKIEEFIEDCQKQGYLLDGYRRASTLSNVLKIDPDYSLSIVQLLKRKGVDLSGPNFNAIFESYVKTNNAEGIYSTLANYDAQTKLTVNTITNVLFPSLFSCGEDPLTTVRKLQAQPIGKDIMATFCLISLLNRNQGEDATPIVQEFPIKGRLLANYHGLFDNVKDWNPVIQLLPLLSKSCDTEAAVVIINNNFLEACVHGLANNPDELKSALSSIQENRIAFSKQTVDAVRGEIVALGLPDDFVTIIDQLQLSDMDAPQLSEYADMPKNPQDMDVEELEKVVSRGLETGQVMTRMQVLLLIKYISKSETEKAEALKTQLEEKGVVFHALPLRVITEMYCVQKLDLENSLKYLNKLTTEYPDYTNYDDLIICIATLKAENNQQEEALAMIRDYVAGHPLIHDSEKKKRLLPLGVAQRLIEAVARTGNMKLLHDTVENLFSLHLRLLTSGVLGCYVQVFTQRNDVKGTMEALRYCAEKHITMNAPVIADALDMFLEKGDTDNVEKVIEMARMVENESTVMAVLARCFVTQGKVAEAAKLLERLGSRMQVQSLLYNCRELSKKQQHKELERYVEVIRSSGLVNRDPIFYELIKCHCETHRWDKAIFVLDKYDQDNQEPSRETLQYLAGQLTAAGVEVPFVVPEDPNPEYSKDDKSKSRSSLEIRTSLMPKAQDALAERNYGKIYQLKSQYDASAKEHTTNFFRSFGSHLVSQGHQSEYRKLIDHLEGRGDTESLLEMSPGSNAALLRAYLDKDQYNVAIGLLNDATDLDKLSYLSNDALEKLYKNVPEFLEPILQDLTRKMPQMIPKKQRHLQNVLFTYYIETDQYDKARQFIQNKNFDANLSFLSKRCARINNSNALRRLIDEFPFVKNNRSKMRICLRSLLDVLVAEKQWEKAILTLDEAASHGIDIGNFKVRTLENLQTLLRKNNQPIPWKEDYIDSRKALFAAKSSSQSEYVDMEISTA